MGGRKASVRAVRPPEKAAGTGPAQAAQAGRRLPKLPEGAWGVRFDALKRAWHCAEGLFDPQKAPERLEAIAGEADDRAALMIFALGGFVVFALWFLSSIEYIYVLNFEFQTLGEATGVTVPQLELGVLAPIAAYEFLLWCVLGTIINLAQEGVAFALARLIGGKGTLGRQMYLSSIVWLAVSFSMAAMLLGPLYLCCILAVASLALVSLLYLSIYMGARAYSIAHGIDFPYALAISIVLAAPKVLIIGIAMELLAAFFGVPNFVGG